MRNTYELEDWEYRLVLRIRQLNRDRFAGLVHVELPARAIVALVQTQRELLDAPPAAAARGPMPPVTGAGHA